MFWNAIKGGLSVLLHWETYVMMLAYFAISFIPPIMFSLGLSKSRFAGGLGCLGMVLLPVFQTLAMCIYIITLSPIIFGFSDSASFRLSWEILIHAPIVLLKLTGLVLAVTVCLSFIPIIGSSQSLQSMISGGIILISMLGLFEAVSEREITRGVELVPNIWITIGFLFIAALCTKLSLLVAAIVLVPLQKVIGEFTDTAAMIFGSVLGFLPVFIYGAWLGDQIIR